MIASLSFLKPSLHTFVAFPLWTMSLQILFSMLSVGLLNKTRGLRDPLDLLDDGRKGKEVANSETVGPDTVIALEDFPDYVVPYKETELLNTLCKNFICSTLEETLSELLWETVGSNTPIRSGEKNKRSNTVALKSNSVLSFCSDFRFLLSVINLCM